MLLKAALSFGVAATLLGSGPLAGTPGLLRVKAELAAARPQAKLAARAEVLFHSGLPRPAGTHRHGDAQGL
ncbi:MAG: hypothetical protein JO256_12385 [Alphaproteobacteria bacterium]|nr:hypothetical protein [Alphaproteobacteria bacterium]